MTAFPSFTKQRPGGRPTGSIPHERGSQSMKGARRSSGQRSPVATSQGRTSTSSSGRFRGQKGKVAYGPYRTRRVRASGVGRDRSRTGRRRVLVETQLVSRHSFRPPPFPEVRLGTAILHEEPRARAVPLAVPLVRLTRQDAAVGRTRSAREEGNVGQRRSTEPRARGGARAGDSGLTSPGSSRQAPTPTLLRRRCRC